jgi:hypothetical protein
MRKNKLIAKSKALSEAYNLPKQVEALMAGCVFWFTASSAQFRAVRLDSPKDLFAIHHKAAKHYREFEFTWTVCTVILDRDEIHNQFKHDTKVLECVGTYEDVANTAYYTAIDDMDKMNKKRRKNVAIFMTVGDVDFDEELIDKLIAVDPEFYESQAIQTEADIAREREQQIRLLECVV